MYYASRYGIPVTIKISHNNLPLQRRQLVELQVGRYLVGLEKFGDGRVLRMLHGVGAVHGGQGDGVGGRQGNILKELPH